MVLVEHGDDVIVCKNTLRRRVRVRLLANRLDCDLAAGISPDATMEHSLRAQHLNSPKQRKRTARSLWRSLDDAWGLARNPVHPSVPIPLGTRAAVLASAWEIHQIATRLSSAQPLSSQGLRLRGFSRRMGPGLCTTPSTRTTYEVPATKRFGHSSPGRGDFAPSTRAGLSHCADIATTPTEVPIALASWRSPRHHCPG